MRFRAFCELVLCISFTVSADLHVFVCLGIADWLHDVLTSSPDQTESQLLAVLVMHNFCMDAKCRRTLLGCSKSDKAVGRELVSERPVALLSILSCTVALLRVLFGFHPLKIHVNPKLTDCSFFSFCTGESLT